MRVVIALGGNALLRRGQSLDADVQRFNVLNEGALVDRSKQAGALPQGKRPTGVSAGMAKKGAGFHG